MAGIAELQQLAQTLGLTHITSGKVDLGNETLSNTDYLKPEMIANIATALHTTSDYLLGIEKDDFDYPRVRRLIARNASSMTELEKKELINALFGEE